MLRTIKALLKQDKEHYAVPRRVQDVIPIRRIWNDGIFIHGNTMIFILQCSQKARWTTAITALSSM